MSDDQAVPPRAVEAAARALAANAKRTYEFDRVHFDGQARTALAAAARAFVADVSGVTPRQAVPMGPLVTRPKPLSEYVDSDQAAPLPDKELARRLRARGYLVVKIPACKKAGAGHGSHSLITRTAMCPGEEPMPHHLATTHLGTFGLWCYCACGHGFSDYGPEPTNWQQHKTEFIDGGRDG